MFWITVGYTCLVYWHALIVLGTLIAGVVALVEVNEHDGWSAVLRGCGGILFILVSFGYAFMLAYYNMG